MSVLAVNKRANFDYEILETFEAGIVLYGHEVKAVKNGQISLKGSFVTFKKIAARELPEAYLTNAHIAQYKYASTIKDYDPTRPRQLLLKKREVKYLVGKTHEAGLTLVPLKIYTKRSFIKLEFAVVRGKKKYDKREAIKRRELDRQVRTLTKQKLVRNFKSKIGNRNS
ncbi:SsrA-binding protein [Candidatus Falkowbacteria bacterium CG_4_9_14_3_um_filter_38_19]|uniref:SsrA-binding protein n=2 Tax=Candidatus Falkowiibacteriota TaxID=1752728 RepID=A0A2M6WQY1_9BACT|nr:MAG: SsrA-binding protein [Candidatus Falkowbacteria bacterium CG10_big_fil_rev_8_21_14_0_10_38_22]PJB15996.1 MAG: SsrA-binding protein [Candidatus Falkowbacteria bacterium CG_4_9_14_3_um_filter_38_19]